jgi:hypothetical protein
VTRYVPVGQWSGLLHERPGLFLRRWQVDELVAPEPELPAQPPPVHGPRLPDWSDELPGSASALVKGLTGWVWVPTIARGFTERGASTSKAHGKRPRRWSDVESLAVRLRHRPAAAGAVAVWLRDVGDDVDPPTSWSADAAWIWALHPDGSDRPAQVPVAVGVMALRPMLLRIDAEFRA